MFTTGSLESISPQTGYARSQRASLYPHLWEGLKAAWVPAMYVKRIDTPNGYYMQCPDLTGRTRPLGVAVPSVAHYAMNKVTGRMMTTQDFTSSYSGASGRFSASLAFPMFSVVVAFMPSTVTGGTVVAQFYNLAWSGWKLAFSGSHPGNINFGLSTNSVNVFEYNPYLPASVGEQYYVVGRYDGITKSMEIYNADGYEVASGSAAMAAPGPVTFTETEEFTMGRGATGLLYYSRDIGRAMGAQIARAGRRNGTGVMLPFIENRTRHFPVAGVAGGFKTHWISRPHQATGC